MLKICRGSPTVPRGGTLLSAFIPQPLFSNHLSCLILFLLYVLMFLLLHFCLHIMFLLVLYPYFYRGSLARGEGPLAFRLGPWLGASVGFEVAVFLFL